MKIEGKNAVVTGAASGIGRAIVLALARAGISGIVLADIDRDRTEAVAAEARALSANTAVFECDVTTETAVEELADFAWATFGSISLLFNNAGVIATGNPLQASEADTRWEFDVNVFGVIHGCRAFGRRFVKAGHESWICSTASHNGLGAPFPNAAGYVGTKHAIIGYVDALRLQFGERIGFSVLCPGPIKTAIWNAGRNRPAKFGGPTPGDPANAQALELHALAAEEAGQMAVKGVIDEQFFVLTHPEDIHLLRLRYEEACRCLQHQFPEYVRPA